MDPVFYDVSINVLPIIDTADGIVCTSSLDVSLSFFLSLFRTGNIFFYGPHRLVLPICTIKRSVKQLLLLLNYYFCTMK